ncbi:metal-dependent hydrolase [Clostridium sp. D2Q-14]|uniref:metal-dependent hydrolase n=1 Tax=Anaeromonas gelatinilytica TaxID=2683194 RepID=UPI00193BF67B|nr:metal-dependent hydrolase [Anaeromonas gelatinilytica]MBS4536550.1 metal-dependent hydrolase [Anaeromonas gelatinilytica]
MKIKYLGHSAFMIEEGLIKALIDPFISGNSSNGINIDELKEITHIFVTHGHDDHLGDTVEIAKNNNAKVICNAEIGQYLSDKGLYVHTMHIGGSIRFDFGRVKMTPALHGSGIYNGKFMIDGGNPCGFLIELDDKKLYHAGDTGLTMDMKLLEEENIDIALIPIGGNFTMDIYDAVRAVEFIKPKLVVPMHYDTFPVIKADPNEFKRNIKSREVKIMSIRESIKI